MPLPRPAYEIFVYAPRIEGVHLRGGKVARGGIRWSDRREDFRTEVLGLMKAQMVKNAVIVPVGAKGGFVVKRPPKGGDRAALQDEGVRCYQTLLRGMLDITDNRVGDRSWSRRARRALRRRRSLSRGRGRQGHRHLLRHRQRDQPRVRLLARRRLRVRRLGRLRPQGHGDHRARAPGNRSSAISASWASTARPQPFTVVGIGDMSGDVFGNGMLLSEQIRLLAAFDHRHIFIDPDPDPAARFAERQRLFELPRSSWDDYDRGLISPRRRRLAAHRQVDPAVAPRPARALGVEAEAADARTS